MTEKQFKVKEEDIDCDINMLEGLTTSICCDGIKMTWAEIVDTLNNFYDGYQELMDENEKLKEEIQKHDASKKLNITNVELALIEKSISEKIELGIAVLLAEHDYISLLKKIQKIKKEELM